ncbi:MAG: hypothetical protein D6755_04525, partial [Anaerolineae bacterium]
MSGGHEKGEHENVVGESRYDLAHRNADLTQILADAANAAVKTNTTSGYQRHPRYQRSTDQHIFR